MARAKQRDAWSRVSSLMALIHNVNCVKSDDRVSVSYFDPFAPKGKPAKQPVTILKKVFKKEIARAESRP